MIIINNRTVPCNPRSKNYAKGTVVNVSGSTSTSAFVYTPTYDEIINTLKNGKDYITIPTILEVYGDLYSLGEVSAFGAGSGGSIGGLIQTVYGYSSLGSAFNNATLTDTFNAYTINQLHTRLSQVELGAAVNVAVSGTGNAITGITKNGNVLEFTKGSIFSLVGHTHDYIPLSQKGTANGVASLDANGLIISAQLPSYVDDVIEVSSYANLPVSGESGKIYVTTDTNVTYRWASTTYVEISKSIALGETSSTAYRGDLGAIAYAHSQIAGGTGVHVSSIERTNWNIAYTNNHIHANKSLLDAFSQSDNDVLNHLSIVDGKLKVDIDLYSLGEVSAFGAGSGTGGSGLIQTVYGLSGLGGTYSDATLTDTFNAYAINSLHNRINSLESGSALNFTTTGSGNAVTSVAKSGNGVTVTKGLTFSVDGHTHTFASLTSIPTTLSGYGITDALLSSSYTATDVLNKIKTIDGEGSGLDADLLDGKHDGEITAAYFAPKILSSANALDNISDGVWFYTNVNNPTNSVGYNSALLQISSRWWDRFQLAFSGNNSNSLHFRSSTYESESSRYWNSWKTIAFTDSNVASATKLQTARTIAGVSFDGSTNISIPFANLSSIPTTLSGYGITDAYTKTQTDAFLALKLDVATFNDLFEKVNIGTTASPIYAIKAKYNFYSVGEVSAFGAGAGSGGSGLIQTVYGYSGLGGTYNDVTLTDTFNAYTINKINTDLNSRIASLESGSALTFTTTGSGNAVTSVTKSGTSVTVTKGLTFSVDGHTHTFDSLTSKPTTLGGYGITDALNLSGGQLTGQLGLLQGAGGGITFPNDSFGGSGDSASIKLLNPIGGESTEMTFTMANDADDIINFSVPSIDGVKINRYTVWNAGNFTNLNQLTTRNFSDLQNKPTTLSGYGITDAYTKTLADNTFLKLAGGTLNGNLSFSNQASYIRLSTTKDGYAYIGSSGFWTPPSGEQDYGVYISSNAYRNADGKWYHGRTDSIPAFRFKAGYHNHFVWSYSPNVGAGEITFTDLMSLRSNGNLGIGTTSPAYKLDVAGTLRATGAVTGGRFYAGYDSNSPNSMSCSNWFRSNGTTGWYNDTYGGGITMIDSTYVRVVNNKAFWVDNNIVATGEITAFGASDIRLKSNIKQIDSALDFLSKVKTYEFEWNEKAIALNPLKAKRGAGVIAQEMSLLDNNFVHSIYGDYLGVDYERFIPYLIGGVNEVADEVTILKKRVAELELEIKQLSA